MEWLTQDIDRLVLNTFEPIDDLEDLDISLTKSEENNLLNKFNEIVLNIAEREKINPTLFFSRKNQKNFLRLIFNKEDAYRAITGWRTHLIKDQLDKLLLEY